jgi:hypothetical protein
VRNEAHLRAIRAVLAAFGESAQHFVFVGGCALGLYARADGAPLRMTEDVVAWHLDRRDATHAARATEALTRLAGAG